MGASTESADASAADLPSALERSCAARRRSMPYFKSGCACSMSSSSSAALCEAMYSAGSRLSGRVTAHSSILVLPASGVIEESMNSNARSAAF